MPSTDGPGSATLAASELSAHLARAWRALPAPARSVRVGLSGGLDSTVLLHLLATLRDALGFPLAAAHVRHGLVAGSAAWADECRTLCAALDVPLQVCDVKVERRHPGGLEAAARDARRAALLALDGGRETALVALAHHQGDQAETVLFRLLRGAGVKGCAAMRAFTPGAPGVWRPLLDVPRAALLAYARARGLGWVEDPSNADARFSRNFLRNDILPRIAGRFPGASASLARAARLCGEAAGLLDELAAIDRAALGVPGGRTLQWGAALALSPPRLRNLFRVLLEEAGEAMPDEDRLAEMARQFALPKAAGGLRMVVGGSALCVYRERWWLEPAQPAAPPEVLAWHGEERLRWAGGSLVFRLLRGEGVAVAALVGATCTLRPRAGGERLRLAPGGPSRSLKNLLQEAAVPPWQRARLPLLWVGAELAWVAELGVAAQFRCPPDEVGVLPEWVRNEA